MAYAEPIPSAQPNATDHEKVAQASEILERLGRGESTRAIAAAMGINRSTLFARAELINQPLPTTKTVRRLHFERLETMLEGLQAKLDSGDISNLDYGRLIAEQRQVLARQAALLRVDQSEVPVDPRPKREAVDWEVGEDDE